MGSISRVPFPTPTNSLQWAKDLDYVLGAPDTPGNLSFWQRMANAESSSGFGLNPGGNTQQEPGSTPVPGNSAGVQKYADWATSLAAYESVLTQSNNRQVLADLRGGKSSGQQLANEVTAPGASWYGGFEASAGDSVVNFTARGPAGSATGTGQDQGLFGRLRHDIAAGANVGGNATNAVANAPADAASAALSGAFSGVVGPLVGNLKRDIYDWVFVIFGLMLIVVGLVVTFKSPIESGAKTAAPLAAAAA